MTPPLALARHATARRRDWSSWHTSGFAAVPTDTWESVASVLPRPWRDDWAVGDLRFWQSVATAPGARQAFPSRTQLARRWGWSEQEVRGLLAHPAAWCDPTMTGERAARWAEVEARRTSTGPKNRPGTGPEPANTQPGTGPEPADDGPTSEVPEDGTSPEPANNQPTPSPEPANRHRGAVHPAPDTQHPTPIDNTHTAQGAGGAVGVWRRHRASLIRRLEIAEADVQAEPPAYVVAAVRQHGEDVALRVLTWVWRSQDSRAVFWRAQRRLVGPGLWRGLGDALPLAAAWERDQARQQEPQAAEASTDTPPEVDREAALGLLRAMLEPEVVPLEHAVAEAQLARELGNAPGWVRPRWLEVPRQVEAAWMGIAWAFLDGGEG